MAVDGVNSTNTPTYSSQQQPKEFKNNLDKDSFLNILVTQLRNQNPLQPMDDTQFIGQMAQFSALEQAQNMDTSIKLNSANNMVNKVVKANYKDEDTSMTKELVGVVQKVTVKNGEIYLNVDDNGTLRDVKLDDVTELTELENSAEQSYLTNINTKLAAANGMIGKDIKGKYYTTSTNADGTSSTKGTDIEGTVTGVIIKSGEVYLKVSDQNVRIEDISEINE